MAKKKKVVEPNNNYSKKALLALSDSELDEKVIIRGTKFDRNSNKVVKASDVAKMKKMYDKGMTPLEIAKKLGYSTTNVRYYVDAEFNKKYRERRSKTHYGKGKVSDAQRIEYKRKLVTAGAKLFVK